MDDVIAMFEPDIPASETRIAAAVRGLIRRHRPRLAAGLGPSNLGAYTDPLVLAYFQGDDRPGVTLDQLLIGHMDPGARPREAAIMTDLDGSAEIPGIGILRTNHPAAEMSLDDQFNVKMDGNSVSACFEPQALVRFAHEPVLDARIAPPLRFILGTVPAGAPAIRARKVEADLRRAVDILERVQPDFAHLMNRTTRRIVVFDHPAMNSLAAPRAHGAVFLNLAHGSGAMYHLEDLLHQCGHVAFQAMTMDPATVLSVDPNAPVGQVDEGPEPRTAYVVLHAVTTERWMVRGLLACLRAGELTETEHAEARGRLAYILQRYILDLVDLVDADVTSPRGTALLRQLLDDLRTLHHDAQPFIRGLDLSGQPYNFNMAAFLERNTQLIPTR